MLFILNAMHLPSQTLNLYSMLGVVMLVGLVAKNGILLIEYAERAVRGGAGAAEAIASAAQVRLRPILMTTAAMIAGCCRSRPDTRLALSTGAPSEPSLSAGYQARCS